MSYAPIAPARGTSARLNECTKLEWWDVCRKLKPALTWPEYERLWAEFQRDKRQRQLQ